MVEHWRLAARAAALAEHDTNEQVSAQMTATQAQALVGDVAALTQALVVLDQRYRNTPGWEPLAQSARLGWASLAAALDVNLGQPDYAVDHLGWRPKTKVITGPVRPGILGVLQAQHNLVIRMKSVPNATNLRLVVDSQRLVSAHLAPYAARIDERLAARWAERAETYSVLQKELREIGGLLGKGGLAVAEGSNAVARLKALPDDTIVEPRVLSGFQLLFNRLDNRIGDVIEDGVEHGAFFKRVTLPRLARGGGQLVRPVRERFVPVTSATDLAVVKTVRKRLRPKTRRPRPPQDRPESTCTPRSSTVRPKEGLSMSRTSNARTVPSRAAHSSVCYRLTRWPSSSASLSPRSTSGATRAAGPMPTVSASTCVTTPWQYAPGSRITWPWIMASVERRERKGRNGEIIRTYRVRWWGPNGKQRSKSFKRKVDADRFAATVSADIVRGPYIDPDAGKVRFEDYAEHWLKAQSFEEGTFVAVESRLRNHAYPALGQRFLNDIQPSSIQSWISSLEGPRADLPADHLRQRLVGLHRRGR